MSAASPLPSASGSKTWSVIFPQYLDATLGPSDGRRLTKSQAVENPSVQEIAMALAQLGYRNFTIDKEMSYPRSQGSIKFVITPLGCIRVQIKEPHDKHYIRKSEFDQQTRAPVVPGIESKQELLRRIAAVIKASGAPRPRRPTVSEVIAEIQGEKKPKK